MAEIATQLGYETPRVLHSEQATLQTVRAAIHEAAKALKTGDIFLLTYAGHGGQVPDRNHDEDDHRHEREPEEEPRRHLRADAASEPERGPDPVPPDRAASRPASGPLALVAVVAEVEDLRRPGRHDAVSASLGSTVSRAKTSASECRAGASR